MCDIMPTIAEDGNSSQGDRDSQVSAEGNTVEDMLLSILDERDRLMENFQEAQEQLNYSQNRLTELEREKDCLSRQLREKIPEVCFNFIVTLFLMLEFISFSFYAPKLDFSKHLYSDYDLLLFTALDLILHIW